MGGVGGREWDRPAEEGPASAFANIFASSSTTVPAREDECIDGEGVGGYCWDAPKGMSWAFKVD